MKSRDSLIWENPASDDDPFADLVIPENFKKLIKESLSDPKFKDKLNKRIASYRTKINWKSLLKPI